ncbi:uncharacterized protein LOC141851963 [Brevipalpus obovatus]|uniref:uncharacterized protein LOC141851963 n=1 Tax=Brevipalpus obovatus TaxID=246614 RepID=UPI003D9EE20B
MNTLIVIFVTTLAIMVSSANAQPGGCHMRELDLCTATLLVFTQNPQGLTGTEQEIERQCAYIREADSCQRNYTSRCLTPLQRDLITFMGEGGKTISTEFCTQGSDIRAQYKKHAKCVSEARSESKQCSKDLQRSLEEISRTTVENRIAMACCGYNRFDACSGKAIKQKCGPDALELSRKIIRLSSSRLPEIVCQTHPATSSKCIEILPPAGTEPLGAQSNSVLSRIFSSYTGN